MSGFVYAIKTEAGPVKIGWSKNPISRFRKMRTDCASPCELVGYAPGSKEDERAAHKRLSAFRLHGEWFRHEMPVAKFINALPIKPPAPKRRASAAVVPVMLTGDTYTEKALARVRAYFEQADAAAVRAWAERAGIPYGTARSALTGSRGPTAETLRRLESAVPRGFRIPKPAAEQSEASA